MPFTIVTHYDSLRLTLNKKDVCPRIMRWALFFLNYDYKVIYRFNKQLFQVDTLSRVKNILILETNIFEQVLSIKQSTDHEIVIIRKKLVKSDIPFYELRDGSIYCKISRRLFFYDELIEIVKRTCHDNVGHVSVDKSLAFYFFFIFYINNSYRFPKMKKKIKYYISKCLKCLSFAQTVVNPKDIYIILPRVICHLILLK